MTGSGVNATPLPMRSPSEYGRALMRFGADLMRFSVGLPVSDALDAAAIEDVRAAEQAVIAESYPAIAPDMDDAAPEGTPTLLALGLNAEIAIDDRRTDSRSWRALMVNEEARRGWKAPS
jgi:hypothetical protein